MAVTTHERPGAPTRPGGTPIRPGQLHPLPSGRPWRVVPDPNALDDAAVLRDPLYFTKHMVDSAQKHLSPSLRLHDATSEDQARLFRQAVETTLNHVQAVTTVGALTRLDNGSHNHKDPSIDYLCHWADVTETWQGNVITVIVRQRPVEGIPEIEQSDRGEPVNVAVTLVPVADAWEAILRGEPVPPEFATTLIAGGQRFSPDSHCVWVKRPLSEIFVTDPRPAT